MAVRRVSRPMPYEASARVSACMRTAGRCPPDSDTRPTPLTWLIFCARRVFTRFCTSVSGIRSELMASVSTGASAGLTFAYTGRARRSAGPNSGPGLDGRQLLLRGHTQRLPQAELQRDDRQARTPPRSHARKPRHLAQLTL